MRAGSRAAVTVASLRHCRRARLRLASRVERGPTGATHRGRRPDLNGVWQALNTANYDIQAHPARPALALIPAPPPRRARARPSHPPIFRRLPVRASARSAACPRAKASWRATRFLPAVGRGEEEGERRALAGARSGNQVLHARRAARHLHAVSVSDLQGTNKILIAYEFAGNDAHDPHGHGGQQSEPDVDGLVARPLGGRDARRRRDRLQRSDMVRQAGNFHSDALHVVERYTPVSPYHLMYEVTIEDPKVFTRPWKMRMPLYRRFEQNSRSWNTSASSSSNS